jgi:hypothetical protein
MGGYGSGRHGTRRTVESCLMVDVNFFARRGLLKKGMRVTILEWSWRGQVTEACRVQTSIEDERATCVFQFNDRKVVVILAWYVPGYGGRRFVFLCPRCGRRMRTLFFKGSQFACRRCFNLTYISSNENHKYDSVYRWMSGSMKVHWRLVKMRLRMMERDAKKGPRRSRGRPRKLCHEVA